MLTVALKRELEQAVETALMLASPNPDCESLAESIYNSQPELMAKIAKPLTIERLRWVMKRVRNSTPSLETQMLLPGFPNLPQRIRLKDGSRPLLKQSTLAQLKEFRQVLLKRKGFRLRIVEKLIDFMTPYAQKDAKITVLEVAYDQSRPR